jgi:hypothetical protein
VLRFLQRVTGTSKYLASFTLASILIRIRLGAGINDRQARRHAVSEWLMEFSVLWAVFPLLDQMLEDRPIRVGVLAASYAISMIAAFGGILLRRAEFK